MRKHLPFALVLLAVLLTRLWFAFEFPVLQISDYGSYYNEARGLAGLTPLSLSAWYTHGPKFLFAAWFAAFGDALQGVGVLNTLIYAGTLTLIYVATTQVFGRATALLAIIIAFVSLSEMYFINLTSTEVPGGFFMGAIYFLLRKGPLDARRAVLMGIAGGLSVYNRSNMLSIGGLIFLHEFLLHSGLKSALGKSVGVQAIAMTVTLPLAFFNQSHFGRFTPLIANSEQLWLGNNPKLSGDFHKTAPIPEDLPVGSAARAELAQEYASFYVSPDPNFDATHLGIYDRSDLRVPYAIAWIKHNKARYLQLVWARFQFFFFSCTYGEVPFRYYDPALPGQPRWEPGPRRLIEQARLPIRRLYQFLIGGALIGLIVTAVKYGPLSFLRSVRGVPFVIIVFYSTPFILSVAANRYHVPILNFAWIYLAHGLVLLGQFVTRSGAVPAGQTD